MQQWPADKTERWPVTQLVPYARNARTHSPAQVSQIAASIREWGFTNPVLADEDGGIIAGHGRVLAAQQLGLPDVPVMVARGWTEAQRRAYVLADNKLALNAGWDDALLGVELADLQGMGVDLALMGFSADEFAALSATQIEGLTDPDDVPEMPADPTTQLGDIWLLGRHRLLCGDALAETDLGRVLDGQTADLVVFDPPYELDAAWDAIQPAERRIVFTDYRRIQEAVGCLVGCDHVYQFVWDGCTSWFTPNRPLARHKSALVGLPVADWNFDAAVYRDDKQRRSHEVTNTRGTYAYSPRNDGAVHLQTVYVAPNTKVEGAHAHAKPVAWVRALMAGAGGGSVVLDQFAGSGTTLIAAGEARQVCAVEIDPALCDVIVERWEAAGGAPARRA